MNLPLRIYIESFIIQDRIVAEPLARSLQFDAMETIAGEVVNEMMPDVVREAIFDVILEDYINSNLIPEVVREQSRDVVIETLKKFDSRVESKQRRAVNSYAKEKLMDTFSLDHVLDLIAKSGQIFTDDQHKEKMLDGQSFFKFQIWRLVKLNLIS